MRNILLALLIIHFFGCANNIAEHSISHLSDSIPVDKPLIFMSHLVPDEMIIHKGVFNAALTEYYYTLSDKKFEAFNVYVIKYVDGKWTDPKEAFFNSSYSEHGMSFSPDGNSIYFSSTRPVNIAGVSETWHLWRSDKNDDHWSEPIFVDIPNLRDKLLSHPIVTNSGTIYFHSSNLDYSDMDIYQSRIGIDGYEPAVKTTFATGDSGMLKCTPYVSPDESYIIFSSVGRELELMIAFNDGAGRWGAIKSFDDEINLNGQGNPFVTSDGKYLFFTTGRESGKEWHVKWVNFEKELKELSREKAF